MVDFDAYADVRFHLHKLLMLLLALLLASLVKTRLKFSLQSISHHFPPFGGGGGWGKRGGLIISALDSGSSSPGSGPGRGHCVVFLGKTLHSHDASLHPGV